MESYCRNELGGGHRFGCGLIVHSLILGFFAKFDLTKFEFYIG